MNGFNVSVGFILHSFISWFTDVREKEALSQKTKSLELEMLKLKLDPHFLFNKINNIDVLIEADAKKASEYIIKLSSILRFYLYQSSEQMISLQDELRYIREYVELQKIRTSNEDFVHLIVEGNPDKREIAPMTFIPFIENAFKHSQNKKMSQINIHISILENQVNFSCVNKVNDAKSTEKGIGNHLIEDRLKLIYGERYALHVDHSEENYTINLSIPV
ncbi:MAG: histidine kinase [Bacteroidota bacterium]